MPSFSSTLFVLTALLSLGYASPAPALDNRQLGSTFNELVSGACRGTTIIYARGTTEAGNVGSVAGPPFFTALGSALGGRSNLAVQGVDYPADVAGFLAGGSRQGISRAAELVRLAQSKCPQTKIVLSGYSQGAQVVRGAAAQLSGSPLAVVVMFGDPNNSKNQPFPAVSSQADVKTFCNFGDLICSGQSIILVPHLTYGNDASAAARFVVGRL